ncbi:MAG TPA: MerR family transcriptional regulator [Rhizomicrobium sp.]|nr:MerR family transcriptional regulator [Rhizomicrobium sp.]
MSSAAYAYPHKSAEAFRTISEVAIELDVPQHVLRFWESRFIQIKPVKRAGGRRYYRPEDVDLLKGIRALLYSDGLTIKGVQKVLKERGLRHVAEVGRGGEPAAPEPIVIEKIVYVEKPAAAAAPAKKPRATHLRAVPDAMSLPFFDALPEVPKRDFPVLDAAPRIEKAFAPIAPEPVLDPAAELVVTHEPVLEPIVEEEDMVDARSLERARLEELLEELLDLKARLKAVRTR